MTWETYCLKAVFGLGAWEAHPLAACHETSIDAVISHRPVPGWGASPPLVLSQGSTLTSCFGRQIRGGRSKEQQMGARHFGELRLSQ